MVISNMSIETKVGFGSEQRAELNLNSTLLGIAEMTRKELTGFASVSNIPQGIIFELACSYYFAFRSRKFVKEGGPNVDSSRQPGLIAYLTREGCESVGKENPGIKFEKVMPNLFALILPEGFYSMGLGGGRFYNKAGTPIGDNPVVSEGRPLFDIGYRSVVRVEGWSELSGSSDREVWQNFNYNLDGTPKYKKR